MIGLRGALALLTRVPVGSLKGRDDPSTSILWFPVVGAGVGLCVAGVYAAGLLLFPALIAAALAVGSGVVLTGAFHEDGLGDTADAFWGGWTAEQRLEILKDPRMGAYGSLAVLFAVLLRILAISSLGSLTALGALVGAHALSRTSLLLALWRFPPASEGLGSIYVRATSPGRTTLGVALGLAIAALALGWWAVPAAGAAVLICVAVGTAALRKLGGVTGDVLGAVEQVTEVSILLMLAA